MKSAPRYDPDLAALWQAIRHLQLSVAALIVCVALFALWEVLR